MKLFDLIGQTPEQYLLTLMEFGKKKSVQAIFENTLSMICSMELTNSSLFDVSEEARIERVEKRLREVEAEVYKPPQKVIDIHLRKISDEDAKREIVTYLLAGNLPVEVDIISVDLNIPIEQVNKIVKKLSKKGVIEIG